MTKIGVIVQARMGSSRLPDKVLMGLPFGSEISILEHIVKAVSSVKEVGAICIATSIAPENDLIDERFKNTDVLVFRGDENNVLNRVTKACEKMKIDHTVNLTGDNPVVDPTVLKELIDFHINNDYDRSVTEGLPLGTNISIVKYSALKDADENTNSEYDKEHVEPYVINNNQYSNGVLSINRYKDIEGLRLTVDYPSDYALLNMIFCSFKGGNTIKLQDILELYRDNSWIQEVNNGNYQKRSYPSVNEELRDAAAILRKLEMNRVADKILDEIDK